MLTGKSVIPIGEELDLVNKFHATSFFKVNLKFTGFIKIDIILMVFLKKQFLIKKVDHIK